MNGLVQKALADPFAALRAVLGDPLHPGGADATEALLDRAEVGPGTRLVDLGCGSGQALDAAQARGARVLGVDRRPGSHAPAVCADLTRLPMADGCADVALSECSLCLAPDLDAALAETARVLAPGGRLAFSDVTLDRELGTVPAPIARALCLEGARSLEDLLDRVRAAGFSVEHVEDHHEDLVAIREGLRSRVDLDGLLGALGEKGERLRGAVAELEAALEARELGYVSVLAQR